MQNCKLGDFGSSRQLGGGLLASTLTGTPLYMAPEVFHRQVRPTYALLASTSAAFDGDSVATRWRRCQTTTVGEH